MATLPCGCDGPEHVLSTCGTKTERPLSGMLAGPDGTLACGCQLGRGSIAWCPTHAAAPEMLALLRRLVEVDELDPRTWEVMTGASIEYADAFSEARALLARLEGGA